MPLLPVNCEKCNSNEKAGLYLRCITYSISLYDKYVIKNIEPIKFSCAYPPYGASPLPACCQTWTAAIKGPSLWTTYFIFWYTKWTMDICIISYGISSLEKLKSWSWQYEGYFHLKAASIPNLLRRPVVACQLSSTRSFKDVGQKDIRLRDMQHIINTKTFHYYMPWQNALIKGSFTLPLENQRLWSSKYSQESMASNIHVALTGL